MKTLTHYTLNTDHVAHTPRSQVTDEAIEFCWSIIKKSLKENKPIYLTDASLPAYSILCKQEIGKLFCEMFADICGEKNHLVSFTITRSPQPRCDVTTQNLDITSVAWLGDLERCIAWAWIERGNHD
jgi:hypothetical protein